MPGLPIPLQMYPVGPGPILPEALLGRLDVALLYLNRLEVSLDAA